MIAKFPLCYLGGFSNWVSLNLEIHDHGSGVERSLVPDYGALRARSGPLTMMIITKGLAE